MGEATYYLRARFESEQIAESKLEEIQSFIDEGCKAYDYWQTNRHKSPEEFWPLFHSSFPAVTEYLGELADSESDCNNGLAGKLDFGPDGDLEVFADEIRFSAYVWHFADWDPFCAYLSKKFGAISTGYASDEYMDINPWDFVEIDESTSATEPEPPSSASGS